MKKEYQERVKQIDTAMYPVVELLKDLDGEFGVRHAIVLDHSGWWIGLAQNVQWRDPARDKATPFESFAKLKHERPETGS